MTNNNGYVGKLFINEIKNDGKIFKKGDKYLRGTIDGKAVVGFLSKDGGSFNIKEDDAPSKPEFKKGAAKKGSSKAPF